MFYLLAGIVGVVIGIVGALVIFVPKSVGSLRIETSDSDGPFLFLELGTSIESLWSKKRVVMDIKRESYISRK